MSLGAGRTLAQAKINLSLRVLGKEPDGFHSIETVFLRIALGDDVRVHIREQARMLRCGVMRDQPPEENLAFRAATLYSAETGWPGGFEIVIKKRIPIGGGLGGGSADAAAVLRILNTLSPSPLSAAALRDLAARLGSDVPFLTSGFVMALGWVGARNFSSCRRYRVVISSFFFRLSASTPARHTRSSMHRGALSQPTPPRPILPPKCSRIGIRRRDGRSTISSR